MPDLSLSFTDPAQLEDCAFHPSVRYGRWNKDKVVSFVPRAFAPSLSSRSLTLANAADGGFNLMTFSLGGPSKPSITSNPLLTLLPLSIRSQITSGSSGTSLSISLTSRAPPSRPLTNLVLRLPLGKGANGVNVTASGGGYLKDSSGKSVGGGAGSWEVESEGQVLVWRIAELVSTDRPAVLQGQNLLRFVLRLRRDWRLAVRSAGGRPAPAFSLEFDCPSSGFSGLRIAGLKVVGEAYSIYEGVRLRGKGKVEVRCA